MASLEELLEWIKRNPPRGEGAWWWSIELDNSLPGWQTIVKNPDNWPAIEAVRPLRSFSNLCEVLVDVAGAGLAKRWVTSSVPEQAKAASEWIRDVWYIGERLTADLWSVLSDQMKRDIVLRVFDKYPGQPFDTWNRMAEHRRIVPFEIPFLALPVVGYIPSRHVLQLRSIVEAAGDRSFLQLIDDMIAQREKACQRALSQPPVSQRIPYTPSRDERELIARAMGKARQGGFLAAALPQIFLSFEAPPLFVAYPELEHEGADEDSKPLVPQSRQRGRPEVISIEEVLGCYVPNSQIVLYARGLKWFARKMRFDEKALRAVVLLHEIGHWMTHVLPKPGIPEWPLDLYKLTEEDVHEGWAQLITWWVAEEVGGKIKEVFEELNKAQPSPYRVFEKFRDKPVGSVMTSLEGLRQLRWPARLQDWERFMR